MVLAPRGRGLCKHNRMFVFNRMQVVHLKRVLEYAMDASRAPGEHADCGHCENLLRVVCANLETNGVGVSKKKEEVVLVEGEEVVG